MKFSTKYNLLFFGLLFSIIIVGQEKIILNGNIRDINGNPISNANIKVISNELEEITGAVSDKNGLFNLSLSNFRTTIVITHVNFKKITKTINPERNSTLNIKMRNKVLKTLNVEYKDPGSSPTEILPTINASNIALPSGNIEGLLSSVGFGVRQNNELSSGFSVRGGNFDENLIYVGGINLWRSVDGGVNWNISGSSGNGSNYSYMHVDQHALEFNPSPRSNIHIASVIPCTPTEPWILSKL